jgi:hypothetical protein
MINQILSNLNRFYLHKFLLMEYGTKKNLKLIEFIKGRGS